MSARAGPPGPARGRTVGLQPLLVALVALAVLPLIAFSLWLLLLMWNTGQATARRDLEQMAGALAMAVDREIAGSIRELQRLAEFPSLSPDRFEAFHADARDLVERNPGWSNLFVTDVQARAVLNAALPIDAAPIHADLPHVLEVIRTGRPALSDIYESRRNAEPAIGVAVPVMREGAVQWVLAARLDAALLSEFIAARTDQDGRIAALADRTRRVVARSRDGARFFTQPQTPELQAAVNAQPERGSARLVTLDGVPVLAAWQSLPSGWTITVGSPTALYDGPLRRSIAILVAFGGVVFGGGVLLSLMLARRISAAVEAVAQDAGRLADGEPLPRRRAPIRQFSRLFDSLSEAGRVQREKDVAREQALAALREADRRKDEFLAMLAHELRNPLAPLRNALGLLARTAAPDVTARRALAMADRQVRQLARLVDDLLDVSRITQGKITLQQAPLEVCRTVQEAVEAMRPAIEARGQHLSLQLPAISPWIDADAVRIAQVLENLLSNATKYTDPEGTITVSLHAEAREVAIAVADTGVGLAPEQHERIFELFTQVPGHSDRTQGGLGIGLSLVRRLVALHGGNVVAHSEGPGRGSCFTVRLPRLDDAAGPPPGPAG